MNSLTTHSVHASASLRSGTYTKVNICGGPSWPFGTVQAKPAGRSLRTASTSRATASPQPLGAEMTTAWVQRTVTLKPYPRGCHIVTKQIYNALPELAEFEVGLANIFLQHTSASLTINENADPNVPLDLNDTLDRIVPEGTVYRHDDEGPDDMPAHVKTSLMGASLTLPVSNGRFALGTWQGIYLNEHRNNGGSRRIMVTIQGQKRGTSS